MSLGASFPAGLDSDTTQRLGHACSQCRRRKQKCGGFTPSISCGPCIKRNAHCSFEQDISNVRYNPYARTHQSKEPFANTISSFDQASPKAGSSASRCMDQDAQWAHMYSEVNASSSSTNGDLLRQVQILASRVTELEKKLELAPRNSRDMEATSCADTSIRRTSVLSHQGYLSPLLISPSSSSLSAKQVLVGSSGAVMTDGPLRALNRFGTDDPVEFVMHDPIAHGILTAAEAQVMFMLYFTKCHPNAPFLDKDIDSDSEVVRSNSTILFLAILAVGARFWSAPSKSSCWLHPQYSEIVRLLDAEIMRVTLRPKQEDHKLETVQALILCAHWMPLDKSADGDRYRSRFSEAGAWHFLSLAMRWATALDLEKTCCSSFACPGTATRTEARRFRTMLYLTESDHYLALSARRPCSLNPELLNEVLVNFSQCSYVQATDLRMTALFQIAACTNITKCDATRLEDVEKFERNVQEIERRFISQKGDSNLDIMNQHFPFISLLWYRLAYTSTFLDSAERRRWTPSVLMSVVDCASRILFHLSEPSAQSDIMTAKGKPLTPDPGVVSVLSFAIDHYFVVITYSAFLLVSNWIRRFIDMNLGCLYDKEPSDVTEKEPRDCMLFKLVDLAARTLEACSPYRAHLARRYVSLLRDMANTIVTEKASALNLGNNFLSAESAGSEDQPLEGFNDDLWEIWQQLGLDSSSSPSFF